MGERNNPLMKKIAVYHFQFWKQYNEIIDYIMFDYIIRIIAKNDIGVKKEIEAISINNQQVFQLRNYINAQYDGELKDKIKNWEQTTYLFKLSWKDQLVENSGTLYYHILDTY